MYFFDQNRQKPRFSITHISLSTLPVLADGFSGSCRIFTCKQQACYDLLAITMEENEEEGQDIAQELSDDDIY